MQLTTEHRFQPTVARVVGWQLRVGIVLHDASYVGICIGDKVIAGRLAQRETLETIHGRFYAQGPEPPAALQMATPSVAG